MGIYMNLTTYNTATAITFIVFIFIPCEDLTISQSKGQHKPANLEVHQTTA